MDTGRPSFIGKAAELDFELHTQAQELVYAIMSNKNVIAWFWNDTPCDDVFEDSRRSLG
jgi:hypothetical protein